MDPKGLSCHPDQNLNRLSVETDRLNLKSPRNANTYNSRHSEEEGLTGGCPLDFTTSHEGTQTRLCGVAARQTHPSMEQNQELRSRSTGTGRLAFKKVKRSLTGQRTDCLFNTRYWDNWTPPGDSQSTPGIICKNGTDHAIKIKLQAVKFLL